jgi:hypothetical protein
MKIVRDKLNLKPPTFKSQLTGTVFGTSIFTVVAPKEHTDANAVLRTDIPIIITSAVSAEDNLIDKSIP